MQENVDVKGKIVGFLKDEEMLAIVETSMGNAYLDIGEILEHHLRIGDRIEIKNAPFRIKNGGIITILGYEYRLNGVLIKI